VSCFESLQRLARSDDQAVRTNLIKVGSLLVRAAFRAGFLPDPVHWQDTVHLAEPGEAELLVDIVRVHPFHVA
jgi:hypothetical protein